MNRSELKVQTFMAVAAQISLLGTCDRKKVGAVFIRDGRCICWGFNGAPEGATHCEYNEHGHDDESLERYPMPEDQDRRHAWLRAKLAADGCRNATHAEANGLAFAARQGISTDDSTLFVTVSPCEVCARLLLASGVRHVYYLEEYRDTRGIELIRETGGWAVCLQRDHGDWAGS